MSCRVGEQLITFIWIKFYCCSVDSCLEICLKRLNMTVSYLSENWTQFWPEIHFIVFETTNFTYSVKRPALPQLSIAPAMTDRSFLALWTIIKKVENEWKRKHQASLSYWVYVSEKGGTAAETEREEWWFCGAKGVGAFVAVHNLSELPEAKK